MKRILRILAAVLIVMIAALIFFSYFYNNENRPAAAESSVEEMSNHLEESTAESLIVENFANITLPFEYTAAAVLLYDLDKSEFIYTKNPYGRISPASLTKLMTAVVVKENYLDDGQKLIFKTAMLDEILAYGYTVDEVATFDLKDGEEIAFSDAMNLLLIRSSNDIANLLAFETAGNIENFVSMMNAKATELGLLSTNYTNAHGLDEDELYTSSGDLFLLIKYIYENHPDLIEIMGKISYTVPKSNLSAEKTVETYLFIKDPQFSEESFYYPYILAGKTGFTDEAGRCLISIAKKDGRSLMLILMGVPVYDEAGAKTDHMLVYIESKNFYEWAFAKEEEN